MPPTPSRRPGWRRPLRDLATGYGVLATVALLVVLVVSDGHTVSYVLGLFAVWWLAPALVLVPLATAFRSWRTLAAALVPAVAAGGLLGPYALHRLTSALDADRERPDLRIATFNTSTWKGTAGLEQLVREHHPDVLALQEIAPRQRTGYDREFAAQYPYRSYTPASSQGDGDAVWSRYPIVSVQPVTGLPAGARPSDVVVLDVDGRRLAVVSVHLASPCLFCSPRAAANSPAGTTGEAARVRVGEARRFADLASGLRSAGDAVVVAGDLNSAELNEPLRELRSHGLVDAHWAVGTQPGLTRGSSPGFARVDVVLLSRLDPVDTFEGAPGGSTHSPVVADVAWPR
ncbi:endonuclease/exonuclease/phosphatase family protein [Kineococcus rhizosphaerae]|uniref:Exonuclease III n=1 Tax=Kineococcus rhizosphaerae TaxID=559628 RepID=A0A2T0R5N9_9ACTN|nr:endonuclease/exonuclease/phosphatase family protein [Kineococcus rhizosphaerae]PRY16035.1 exonuclease III [Kineococcus rhizosphaerae]